MLLSFLRGLWGAYRAGQGLTGQSAWPGASGPTGFPSLQPFRFRRFQAYILSSDFALQRGGLIPLLHGSTNSGFNPYGLKPNRFRCSLYPRRPAPVPAPPSTPQHQVRSLPTDEFRSSSRPLVEIHNRNSIFRCRDGPRP